MASTKPWIEIHPRVDAIAEEWDALAERVGASPFRRPGWFAAWTQAFGPAELRVYGARRDGALVGVLPLIRRGATLASPTNWHTPEFGPVARPASVPRLIEEVLADRPRRLSLAFLEWNRPEAALVVEACRVAGYRTIVRTLERSPYIAIDGPWESYEGERNGKFLRELRRRWRRLQQEGPVTFSVERGQEGLPAFLAEGFAVEAAGWKGDRKTAIASSTNTRQFYEGIADWAAERGWLRLGFLRVGQRAIAFDFAMQHDGSHYLLKTGFDPAFRRFAPGALLRHAMLRSVFAEGLKNYEFLGADERWKFDWTRTTRERVLVQAFAPTASGTADWSAFRFGRPLAKWVLPKRVLQTLRR